MATRVITARSAQPITVNALIANPLAVQQRVLNIMRGQFVMDTVLRNAGNATGGAVMYRTSNGLFADNSSEIVSPGGEIPAAQISVGDINSTPVKKRALAVVIDREMRIRNNTGEVDRQLTVVRNTIVRDIDTAFLALLRATLVSASQTAAASFAWSNSSATIRKNINAARLGVANSSVSTGNFTGFVPDTLIINPTTETDLLNSSEFTNLLFGQVNPSDIGGLDGRNILGLDVLVSRSVATGDAYVVQAKQIGGYADEIPLETTPLYAVQPNQVWRADTTRSSAAFVDQPLAGYLITGV